MSLSVGRQAQQMASQDPNAHAAYQHLTPEQLMLVQQQMAGAPEHHAHMLAQQVGGPSFRAGIENPLRSWQQEALRPAQCRDQTSSS
jgi:hypothetical protein